MRTAAVAKGSVKDNVIFMKQPEFKCPYANLPLARPCEVTSCCYNLDPNPQTEQHMRCFLHYCDGVRRRPGAGKNEHDFGAFPQEKKNKLASTFFNVSLEEVDRINSEFYVALFSVFAEDVSVSLRKHQLEPVPFRQCAVCGTECDALFLPGGILPAGFGYCSWGCYQMKPPPVLLIEKNMDLDFADFVGAMEHESVQGRAKFVRQLVEWVLGSTPMRQ